MVEAQVKLCFSHEDSSLGRSDTDGKPLRTGKTFRETRAKGGGSPMTTTAAPFGGTGRFTLALARPFPLCGLVALCLC